MTTDNTTSITGGFYKYIDISTTKATTWPAIGLDTYCIKTPEQLFYMLDKKAAEEIVMVTNTAVYQIVARKSAV